MDNAINVELPSAAGKRLDIGEIFGAGWQYIKDQAGLWIGASVVVVLISLAIEAIPVVGQILGTLVMWPLFSGLSWMGLKRARGLPIQFGDAFVGFGPRLLPLMLGGVLYHVLVGIGIVLLVIPGIYLAVSWSFGSLLILDKNFGCWEGLEASRRTVGPRWWWFFGMWAMSFFVIFLGAFACGVGIFVAIPVVSIAFAIAYHRVFDSVEGAVELVSS